MKKPLFKVEYVKLPLSVPENYADFFQTVASTLGISRNAAMCLALKFGGPILHTYARSMGCELKRSCERISKGGIPNSMEKYQIVGDANDAAFMAKMEAHEQQKRKRSG